MSKSWSLNIPTEVIPTVQVSVACDSWGAKPLMSYIVIVTPVARYSLYRKGKSWKGDVPAALRARVFKQISEKTLMVEMSKEWQKKQKQKISSARIDLKQSQKYVKNDEKKLATILAQSNPFQARA